MSSEKTALLPDPSGQPNGRLLAATSRRRRSRLALVPILLGCAIVAGTIRSARQLVVSSPQFVKHLLPGGNATAVDWAPCVGRETEHYLCGFIDVPTDYADPARGTHRLALAKIPARVKPSENLGILWINPGGPGGSYVVLPAMFMSVSMQQG